MKVIDEPLDFSYFCIKYKFLILSTGHNLYLCFAKFLMSEEDLDMYGYPRPHENYGCALISENVLRKDPPYSTDSRRVCEKCAEPYTVDEDGYPIEGIGKCIYHARKGFIRNRSKSKSSFFEHFSVLGQ